jgi:hypothetical protein
VLLLWLTLSLHRLLLVVVVAGVQQQAHVRLQQ